MPATPKRKRGRPPAHAVTDELIRRVTHLATLGCERKEIAWLVEIPKRSFVRLSHDERIADAFKEGRAKRGAMLRQAQWEAAVKKHNPAMLIWLGKQYLNQREPTQAHKQDLTIRRHVAEMSDAELENICRAGADAAEQTNQH